MGFVLVDFLTFLWLFFSLQYNPGPLHWTRLCDCEMVQKKKMNYWGKWEEPVIKLRCRSTSIRLLMVVDADWIGDWVVLIRLAVVLVKVMLFYVLCCVVRQGSLRDYYCVFAGAIYYTTTSNKSLEIGGCSSSLRSRSCFFTTFWHDFTYTILV